ncbi:MOSC domain-containing protein [Oceanobacillus jordanicus]|uniref:MOSC domain-containing protein n=1 Tax=Oceanobacillus jordanicus TaxID=2867266 RepID=A0AAW5B963_9BACI|nr:MOSC domain-containing protein [Oceanobacillus jordanicus]MCG3419764.1 MOSC domain-containing protein [Oceanobacillus jordanicus]
MEEPYVHKIFIRDKHRFAPHPEIKTFVGKTGLDGNKVTDNPDKAIFCYPIQHYTYWNDILDPPFSDFGELGEDMAVLEMGEQSVCIGDSYAVGDTVLQVSQPKSDTRFLDKEMAMKMLKTGKTGWYFRVLKEGNMQAGSDLTLLERPYPNWTIAACNEVMHLYKDDLRLTNDLAHCELLADNWRKILLKRLGGRAIL